MKALRTTKLLLVAVIGIFAAAAGYISVLIGDRQETLREVSRYNEAWIVSQATTEFVRLEQRLDLFEHSAAVSAAEVQLRFEILLHRVHRFGSGDIQAFIATSLEHDRTVRELVGALEAAKPYVAAIDQSGSSDAVQQLLAPVYPKLAALAAAANHYVGMRVADDQQQLGRLHELFSWLGYCLVLCGLALVALLLWHNRLLKRAHQDTRKLASDLQRTSAELAVANQAVQDANAELHLQNYMLRTRDRELRTQNERFTAALNNMSHALCLVDAEQRLIVCKIGRAHV